MSPVDLARRILDSSLQLGGRSMGFTADTPLLGSIPELDSMAVVQVITAIEEQLGVTVNDDEISAETFATLGSLARFIAEKQG
jgi:acyl carrier protein